MKVISIVALSLLLGEGSAAPWDSFFNQGNTMPGMTGMAGMAGGNQNRGNMFNNMPGNQNNYQPQQNNNYMPQQNNNYMPQQNNNYRPQQNNNFRPNGNDFGSWFPQQNNNFKPQQNRPQQGDNYQPQQNQPQQNENYQPQGDSKPQQNQPQQNNQPQQGGGNGQCNKLGSMPNKFPFQVEMNKYASGIPKGQCTEWADGRYYQLTGTHALFNGDAHRWNELAQGKSGWTVSNTPSVPSIVVIEQNSNGSGVYGHVAVVESMDGDTFCTSNWNSPTLGGLTFKSMKAGPGISFIKYNGN